MKSKIFKIALPVLAIMLAITMSSFISAASDGPQIGYWDNPFFPGIQSGIVDCCKDVSQIHCTVWGYQVYAEPTLITPLKKIFP